MQNALEELLAIEREQFVRLESFVRQLGGRHIRGLPMTPEESLIEMHLAACKDYYTLYGTREGELSPWLVKGDTIDGETFSAE